MAQARLPWEATLLGIALSINNVGGACAGMIGLNSFWVVFFSADSVLLPSGRETTLQNFLKSKI